MTNWPTKTPQPPSASASKRYGSEPNKALRERDVPGRVNGVAEIVLALRDGATRLAHLYQHDPLRVLFPASEPGEAALAVLVTTSGGLVAGDRLNIDLRAAPGATAHITA